MTDIVARESPIAAATARGSPPTRVTSDASTATSAPVPMATPRSAAARAGASLMPSPTMATTCPVERSFSIRAALSAGRASARTRSDGIPTRDATASAVAGPSPVRSQTSIPASIEGTDRGGGFRPHRVADGDEACGRAIDGDVGGRSAGGRGLRCRVRERRSGRHRGPPSAVRRRWRQFALARSRPRRARSRRPPRSRRSRIRLPNPSSSSRALARIAAPSGCSLPFSRAPAASRTSPTDHPGAAITLSTTGRPSVSVPVLSMTTALTR